LGWRVYATNCEGLTLHQAVWAYRHQYRIEHGFKRLKGQPLSLTPMYLQRDDHVRGLVRLLSMGLRVLSGMEYVVRQRLAAEATMLPGLYAGNPTRATARPTAERMLAAFAHVTLTIIQRSGERLHHVTPLTELQRHILRLFDVSPEIYTRLGVESSKPP
jgi:transposase